MSDQVFAVPDADATRAVGALLGSVLTAGHLVVLVGDLGAGKTTFTQGIARGLGIESRVTSPTFVIAREHRNQAGRPDLVHVDAYRLGSVAEIDQLDLDTTLEEAVTVVEWGEGLVEQLSGSVISAHFTRDDEPRTIRLVGAPPLTGEAAQQLTPNLSE